MIFKGAGTALITPFKENGDIDYKAYEDLVDFQVENSIDALIVAGTTGESPVLSEEEKIKLTEITMDRAKGVPVIVGTGSNDTRKAVASSKTFSDMGVDGLLVVTPYYNKATKEGLFKHYEAVNGAVDVPIILYTVPGRTGMGIGLDSLVDLAKLENIRAIKDATGSLAYGANVKNLLGEDFALYSGNDNLTVPYLSIGGSGVISVTSNILPKEMHDMCYNFFEGDYKKAGRTQVRLIDLMDNIFRETSPAPIKAALELMGIKAGSPRLPLTDASEETVALLKENLKDLGVINA